MCHPHSHCNAADLILITQHGVPAVPITVQLSKNISSLKIYYLAMLNFLTFAYILVNL